MNKINDLLICEGATRVEFENFIGSLVAVRYSLKRDEHNEYRCAAVFNMWTGFCIAKLGNYKGA